MTEFDGDWTRRRPDGWEQGENLQYSAIAEAAVTPGFLEFRGKKEIVATVGLLAVIGGLFYASIDKGKTAINSLKPKQTPAPLVASCSPPSQKAINTVERLFSEPVAKARAEYRQLPLDGYEREGSLMLPNLWGTTGEELLFYTKPYFEKYKVDVEVATAPSSIGNGLRPPTEKELDSQNMSNNVLGLVAGLSDTAPHYVLMSGLRKIRLVAGNPHTEFAWEEPHTLDWNIDAPEPNADPVPFELGIALGHFTLDRMCGQEGVNTDPSFSAVNNGPFPSPTAPENQIYGNKKIATIDGYHTEGSGVKAADVKVIDGRATASVSTDKAELLAVVAEPAEVWSAMSADHPVLRAKLIEALAQLYRYQPAVVRRLAVKSALFAGSVAEGRSKPAGNQHDFVFKLPDFLKKK